ncbi:PBECR4 domain-containing protein [Gemella sp. zg-1178]|uniref:PBECR4 domain-containing protein n=1 Tax=Gemella sp. zg-1178 TaxID=2840372 RepID=UPI001C03E736|nr:PBECR4 domain-containing protein [Gemella sp. zg-1178]MBU0279412.1 hypothetical protein [Gemella sp. zg-1178]
MSIDFLELLNDYNDNFCNKKCYLFTNYKNEQFEVSFNVIDLYHLFGIHKICNIHATKWVELVKCEKFSLLDYKSDYLKEVIPRIDSYYFLKEVFLKNSVNTLILGKDLKGNTMNLNIVFVDENNDNMYVVLGLRKDNRNKYRPVTLHVSRYNKYKKYRKTKIKSIEWI